MRKNTFSSKKKDRRKAIRSIGQIIILVFLLCAIIFVLFYSREYVPFKDADRVQRDKGFVAVSYFGVDRVGTETLISKKKLENHIEALKASGYVTITQDDIEAYYLSGKLLPPKALFLSFEDGRRDTAVFSQKILEKHNYKGNMLSYAQNLELKTSKFLSPSDLKTIIKTGFWDLGTNGYRLSYINALDRHNNFFGALDTNQYQMVSKYLDRNYNHYLMDYIRDEYHIPTESFGEMKERINKDYKMIEALYEKHLGTVPKMYAIMHSNTGKFGTNDNVSSVNEENIYRMFTMNFNREGDSQNRLDTSIYDLTRIQPQAYWSTNHLLMRIWNDTKEEMAFVSGDLEKKKNWDTLFGVSEFVADTIILTSLPEGRGLMRLKDSESYRDISASAQFNGNKAGSQILYLRGDADLNNRYISVQIMDNILYVYEKNQGMNKKELYTLDLDIHDEITPKSMAEDQLESEVKYLESKIKYADNMEEAKELTKLLQEKNRLKAKSVPEGEEEYIPKIDILQKSSRFLEIQLKGDTLSLFIDHKKVFEDIKVSLLDPGYLGLESSFSGYGYSQRNLADPVYDGVFKKLNVKDLSKKDKTPILYSNELIGFEKVQYTTKEIWEKIIYWFITYI